MRDRLESRIFHAVVRENCFCSSNVAVASLVRSLSLSLSLSLSVCCVSAFLAVAEEWNKLDLLVFSHRSRKQIWGQSGGSKKFIKYTGDALLGIDRSCASSFSLALLLPLDISPKPCLAGEKFLSLTETAERCCERLMRDSESSRRRCRR